MKTTGKNKLRTAFIEFWAVLGFFTGLMLLTNAIPWSGITIAASFFAPPVIIVVMACVVARIVRHLYPSYSWAAAIVGFLVTAWPLWNMFLAVANRDAGESWLMAVYFTPHDLPAPDISR